MTTDACPHCGAELPPHARACPECGSDERTGWSAQARYDSLDLPDEAFSHAEFVQRELGGGEKIPRGIHWLWWLVAAGLVIFLLAGLR
ncbi:MAG: hypothetical protein RL380_1768 [Verrucomicrobiota bacterium]